MIAQPTNYLNNYYTTDTEVEKVLIKFIKSQYKFAEIKAERDTKGNLLIWKQGEVEFDEETQTYNITEVKWQLKDYDVENVIEVIKSKKYDSKDIWKKFNLKFLVP
jgi:hypothetical protein